MAWNTWGVRLWLACIVCCIPTYSASAQQCILEAYKLTAFDGNAFDTYGYSIAISDDTVVVGAFLDDEFGQNSGSAYLYNAITGEISHQLLPDPHSTNDNFGYSVSIDGPVTVIGSPTDDEHGTDAGSVYIFQSSTGELIAKIFSGQAGALEHFGLSVGVSQNIAIVGAPWSMKNGVRSGAAYLYDIQAEKFTGHLLPEFGREDDQFGRSVAISGSVAVVGATNTNIYGSFSGAAYLFDTETGEQTARRCLTAPKL